MAESHLDVCIWGILWAVKRADQFWSKVALKAASEELNEL